MKKVRKIVVGLIVFASVAAASSVIPDFEIREKAASACDLTSGVGC